MPTKAPVKASSATSTSKFGPDEALEALSGCTMGSLCSYVKMHGSGTQQEEVQVLIDKILANKDNRLQKSSSVQSLTPNQWTHYRQELYEICGDWLWLHATNYWRTNIATKMCVPIRLLQLVLHVDYPPSIVINGDASEQQQGDNGTIYNSSKSNVGDTSKIEDKVKGTSKKQRFLSRTFPVINSNDQAEGSTEDASTFQSNASGVSMINDSDKKRKMGESVDELETGARRSGRTRFKPDKFQPGKTTFKEMTSYMGDNIFFCHDANDDADIDAGVVEDADAEVDAVIKDDGESTATTAAKHVTGKQDEVKEQAHIEDEEVDSSVNDKTPTKQHSTQKSFKANRSDFHGVLYKSNNLGLVWTAQASVPGATRTKCMHSGNFATQHQAAYAVDLARCFLYYDVATGVQEPSRSAINKVVAGDPNMGLNNLNVLSLKQGVEFWDKRPDILKLLMPGMNLDVGNRKKMRHVVLQEVMLNSDKVWEAAHYKCGDAAIDAGACKETCESEQKEEESELLLDDDECSNDNGQKEELSSSVDVSTDVVNTIIKVTMTPEEEERANGTTFHSEEEAKEAEIHLQNYPLPEEHVPGPEKQCDNAQDSTLREHYFERATEQRNEMEVVRQQQRNQPGMNDAHEILNETSHDSVTNSKNSDVDVTFIDTQQVPAPAHLRYMASVRGPSFAHAQSHPHNLAVANSKDSDSPIVKQQVMSLALPKTTVLMAASYDRALARIALSSDVPHSPFPWRLALYFALRGTKRGGNEDNRQLSKLLCGVIQTILASRAVRIPGATNSSVNVDIVQPNNDLMAYTPHEQATLIVLLQIMTQVPEQLNWSLFKCSIAHLLQQMDGTRYPVNFQLIPPAFCSSSTLAEFKAYFQQLRCLSQVQVIESAQQLVGNALHVHDYHTSCMETVRGFKTFSMWAHHTSRGAAGDVGHLIPSLSQAFNLRMRGDIIGVAPVPSITMSQSLAHKTNVNMNPASNTLPPQQQSHRHIQQHVRQNQRHMSVVVNAATMPRGHRGNRLAPHPIGSPSSSNGQPLLLCQAPHVGQVPQNQPHFGVIPFQMSQMRMPNRLDVGSRQSHNLGHNNANHGVNGDSVRVVDSLVGILDGSNRRVAPKVDDSQNTNMTNNY